MTTSIAYGNADDKAMIELTNLTAQKIDEVWIKKIAQKVLKGETKEGAELSVVFVGQGRMRQLSKRYRGKNRSTDVLAFPEPTFFPTPPRVRRLGEVIISLRDVKKNARRFGIPAEQEFARVLIHGILHLLGYEHEKSAKQAKEMFKRQEGYLRDLGFEEETTNANSKFKMQKSK